MKTRNPLTVTSTGFAVAGVLMLTGAALSHSWLSFASGLGLLANAVLWLNWDAVCRGSVTLKALLLPVAVLLWAAVGNVSTKPLPSRRQAEQGAREARKAAETFLADLSAGRDAQWYFDRLDRLSK